MLPKPGDPPSVTLLLGSDSREGASESRAGKRSLISCVMDAAPGPPGAWCSDSLLDFLPDRNKDRRRDKSPAFLLPAGLALTGSGSTDLDRCRLLSLRLRSFLDLTRPMHDTLGEEGSIMGGSDFPVDPERLGNSRAFPVLQLLRLFGWTKHVF